LYLQGMSIDLRNSNFSNNGAVDMIKEKSILPPYTNYLVE